MGKDTPAPTSAFERDKLYGNRLDEAFALHEPFMLLGGKIHDELVPTEIGDAELAKLLVQRLDENMRPKGIPFVCGTLASAVVEKVKALTPEDVPAIVETKIVQSKRWKTKALVMQLVGEAGKSEDDLFADFGVDANRVSSARDLLLPASERIPFGADEIEHVAETATA